MKRNWNKSLVILAIFISLLIIIFVILAIFIHKIDMLYKYVTYDYYTIKVMSYNIRYANDLDTGFIDWSFRKSQIISLIREEMPDIMGLQEVKLRQYDTLKESLPEYDSSYMSRDGKDGEGVPIFYKKSMWSKIDHGTIWISFTPNIVGSKVSELPRIITWIILKNLHNNMTSVVMNTHFDHISVISKDLGINLIINLLKKLTAYGESVKILMGDFNSGSDNLYGFDHYGNLNEAYIKDGKYDDTTFHDWTGTTIGKRIDHIYISRDITCLSFDIIRKYNMIDGQKRYPSDHYPIMAVLGIN